MMIRFVPSVTLAKDRHGENASYPIFVTPLPIITLVKAHPEKASWSISRTLSGIVILARGQLANAFVAMVVTPWSMTTLVIPHPEKAYAPILVTVPGSMTERSGQPEKVASEM